MGCQLLLLLSDIKKNYALGRDKLSKPIVSFFTGFQFLPSVIVQNTYIFDKNAISDG